MRTNLVFFAIGISCEDIEATKSVGKLLTVHVVTPIIRKIRVLKTAVVEDVDNMLLDFRARDSQGGVLVLLVEVIYQHRPG